MITISNKLTGTRVLLVSMTLFFVGNISSVSADTSKVSPYIFGPVPRALLDDKVPENSLGSFQGQDELSKKAADIPIDSSLKSGRIEEKIVDSLRTNGGGSKSAYTFGPVPKTLLVKNKFQYGKSVNDGTDAEKSDYTLGPLPSVLLEEKSSRHYANESEVEGKYSYTLGPVPQVLLSK